MVKQAIEKAGSIDHDAIRDAMSGMHYVGGTGDMTLDETGTPEKSVAILTFTPSDGKLVQKFVKTQSCHVPGDTAGTGQNQKQCLRAKAPPGAFARDHSGAAGLRVNQKGRERI